MRSVARIASAEQKRQLLQVARETVEEVLKVPARSPRICPRIEGEFGGAFVTFWADRKLRGCVGSFAHTDDIVTTIQAVTKESLADPRFVSMPISAGELGNLDIEISILSHLEPTSDPLSLIPGVHGIVIGQKGRSGCFLPKVATEHGWSAEEFLSNCCSMKAGLEPDAWREQNTTVQLFTADVFSESQLSLP